MKNKLLILSVLMVLLGSCKKSDDAGSLKQQVNYSYGNFNVANAIATAELNGRYLSITLGPPSATKEQGGVNIQLHNYTGPGEYQFSEEVIVVADQTGQEAYWENFYYQNSSRIFQGKVTIKKLDDQYLEAAVQGKLFHYASTGELTDTELKASILSYR